ncbi:MAG: nucleoside diphosphate kinase regulator [Caulobacter sp.]|nr:nucleoside diphosphate kinase regulator [Caulobacter sp.]
MLTIQPAIADRPAVFLTIADLERLIDLLPESIPPTWPGAMLLAEEIARAHICADDDLPARVVRLGSTVRYRDLVSGRERTIQLVMPGDADIDRNRVSILSPIGAAVIGMPEEQTLVWTEPSGDRRSIQVLEVQD